ncbi:MAG: hypothetical protein ABIV10_08035 [Gemmatimonadaceae bacterium]
MRRFIALFMLAIGTMTATGCGSDGITDSPSVLGTYRLETYDGAPPPVVLIAGDPKLEVLADQFVLASGGAFTQRTSFRLTDGGVVTLDESIETGTYTVSGPTVTIRLTSDNSSTAATMTGRGMTIDFEGHRLVYARE